MKRVIFLLLFCISLSCNISNGFFDTVYNIKNFLMQKIKNMTQEDPRTEQWNLLPENSSAIKINYADKVEKEITDLLTTHMLDKKKEMEEALREKGSSWNEKSLEKFIYQKILQAIKEERNTIFETNKFDEIFAANMLETKELFQKYTEDVLQQHGMKDIKSPSISHLFAHYALGEYLGRPDEAFSQKHKDHLKAIRVKHFTGSCVISRMQELVLQKLIEQY